MEAQLAILPLAIRSIWTRAPKGGSDLDKGTLAQLTRGERMVEILKQNQYVPMSVENQIAIIFAGAKGHLDSLDPSQVADFEKGLLDYLEANASKVMNAIVSEGALSDEMAEKLEKAISDFKQGFTA